MHAHLAKIAKFLPKWKVVARLLGLEAEIVKDIEDRYRDREDQRSEALMKWIGKEGSQATYGKLYDILLKVDEGETAEMVKELTRGKVFQVNIRVNIWVPHLATQNIYPY